MPFTSSIVAQQPVFSTRLSPKQFGLAGFSLLKRAVLILCDEAHNALEMCETLHRSFDDVADTLFDLYWSGLIQALVIDTTPPPSPLSSVYRIAPLPLSVRLCGGRHVQPIAPNRPARRVHPAPASRLLAA